VVRGTGVFRVGHTDRLAGARNAEPVLEVHVSVRVNRQAVSVMPRGTALQKVERDTRVVADRGRGLAWADVSTRNDLSTSQCRAIWRDYVRTLPATGESRDAAEAVEEALILIDQSIADFAVLAESTNNDAVRLGAMRSRHRAVIDRLELHQRLGVLPTLEQLAPTFEIESLVEALVDVLDEHGDIADPLINDILETLARRGGDLAPGRVGQRRMNKHM
jgi:hypothetical protein